MFICRDIETLIILQILAKFVKTWGTIVVQYGKRFLILSLDEDDQFSKAATIDHRLEHINHLARQFHQKRQIFVSPRKNNFAQYHSRFRDRPSRLAKCRKMSSFWKV